VNGRDCDVQLALALALALALTTDGVTVKSCRRLRQLLSFCIQVQRRSMTYACCD